MRKARKLLLSALMVTTTILSAQTIVTVNGKAITSEEVNQELMNATQGRFNTLPVEKQKELGQQFVQQLVANELMYGDAKKTGVLNSKLFKDEYKKIQEKVKKSIAIQVWQKQLHDKIKVSQKELKEYYKNNKEEFVEKERVHARHILVKTEAEAKKIIAELKSLSGAKLKAKFEELAKAKSTGPSGPKGGDLGTFTKGQMVPAFNDAVFKMKVGTITPTPIKTQFGYHIIYLEDKMKAATRTFDEVKSVIEQRIKNEKFKSVMNEKMAALQKKATIK
jgi:parvulin-like peptidyl-prolyl isomerase